MIYEKYNLYLRNNFWNLVNHMTFITKFASDVFYKFGIITIYSKVTCKINYKIIWRIFLTDILTVIPSTSSVANINFYTNTGKLWNGNIYLSLQYSLNNEVCIVRQEAIPNLSLLYWLSPFMRNKTVSFWDNELASYE